MLRPSVSMTEAHWRSLERIRQDASARLVAQARQTGFARPNVDAMVQTVLGAQTAMVATVDANLSAMAVATTGIAAPPAGLKPASMIGQRARNGRSLESVYGGVAKVGRDQGFDRGVQVLKQSINVDSQLAQREAAGAIVQVDKRIVGWRRQINPTADGKTCGLCIAAATRRYGKQDMLPIHPMCRCTVYPIYSDDPIRGDVIDRERLDALYAQVDGQPNRSSLGKLRFNADDIPPGIDSAAINALETRVSWHPELGEYLTGARHDSSFVLNAAPEVDVSKLSAAAKRAYKAPDDVIAAAKVRAPRRPARVYGVQDDDVIAAARKAGVTPDEVLNARANVRNVKAAMYDSAERVQSRAFMDLDRWQAFQVKTPPRLVKGSRGKSGDYDWLERLDPAERRRLSRNYYSKSGPGPDQVAAEMKLKGVMPGSGDDELIEKWLQTTREYEAAGRIRRGKLPDANSYSGSIDVDDLITIEGGYSPSTILGASDDLDAAAHIASVDRELLADDAVRYLGDAINATEGPAPFQMSFQSWEEEVRTIEYGLREFAAEMPANTRARLSELVPQYLDDGQDYEDLYAAIVTKARQAGMEVPDYVGIPWK